MSLMDKVRSFMGYDDEDYEDEYEYEVEENRALAPRKAERARTEEMTMPAPAAAFQITSIRTNRFEDASLVVDELKAGRTVVLNVQAATVEVTRRMIDFISGAAYARDGHIAQIATGAYLVAPYSVELTDETQEQRYF